MGVKMLDYPRDIPLVTEKVENSSSTNLMQYSSGIFLGGICLCIYRAAVSCRQVKRACATATEVLTSVFTLEAEALS